MWYVLDVVCTLCGMYFMWYVLYVVCTLCGMYSCVVCTHVICTHVVFTICGMYFIWYVNLKNKKQTDHVNDDTTTDTSGLL